MRSSFEKSESLELGLAISELNIETITELVPPAEPELDRPICYRLKHVLFIDPYGMMMLILFIQHLNAIGVPVEVELPESRDVLSWLERMDFFREVAGACRFDQDVGYLQHRTRNPAATLKEVTRIQNEHEIISIVTRLAQILTTRYPFKEGVVNRLSRIMLETFQNIPQHANPFDEPIDPRGIAAIQDYQGYLYLAIGDIGAGIATSLSLNPLYQGKQLSDLHALHAVVEEGVSRFGAQDPGRGGELKRIAALIGRYGGVMTVRSGEGLLAVSGGYTEVLLVDDFPGTQIGIRIPKRVLIHDHIDST
ncbi:MAG: hypothetical protein ACE5JP_00380 [Candidatus Bipolaricaulia bacterium]